MLERPEQCTLRDDGIDNTSKEQINHISAAAVGAGPEATFLLITA